MLEEPGANYLLREWRDRSMILGSELFSLSDDLSFNDLRSPRDGPYIYTGEKVAEKFLGDRQLNFLLFLFLSYSFQVS